MNSLTFTNIPYLLSIGKYDLKGLKYAKANITSVKHGGKLIWTRLTFLNKSITELDKDNIMVQVVLSHIEDSTKYLKTINDWLENIRKKKVSPLRKISNHIKENYLILNRKKNCGIGI